MYSLLHPAMCVEMSGKWFNTQFEVSYRVLAIFILNLNCFSTVKVPLCKLPKKLVSSYPLRVGYSAVWARPANLEKNVDCVQVQVLSLLQLDVKKFYICFSIWISLRSVRGGGLGVKSTVCYQGGGGIILSFKFIPILILSIHLIGSENQYSKHKFFLYNGCLCYCCNWASK